MKIIPTLALLISYNCLFGQGISQQQALKRLSNIFQEQVQKRPDILLLGTYHFSYPNADAYTTPGSLHVDILSQKKQNEIKQVMNVLLKFNPTKIAIEAMPSEQGKYDSLYKMYLKGKLQTERKEQFQIAFKLAKMLGHKSVFCIDAKPFVKTLYEVDSVADQKYSDESDSAVTAIEAMYDEFYIYDDTLQANMKLIDYLTLINADKYLRYDNGQYLYHTRKGTNEEPIGADGFVSKWFNSNARIYSNIERIVTNKNDKILVLFGGSHIPILKFLLESSQEFKLHKLSEFVN